MSDCDAATTALERAEERLRAAKSWLATTRSNASAAQDAHEAATANYNRSVTRARSLDDGVAQRRSELAAAEAKLQEYVNGDAHNRDALISAQKEVVSDINSSITRLTRESEEEWAEATTLAGVQEKARTAITTANNQISVAQDDVSSAEADVRTAKQAVKDACG